MNHECFQVLHPWAYELDSVDFKYIVNNNLTADITKKLEDTDAIVFWLTFFKAQKACAADEFFESIRQLCEINKIQDFFKSRQQEFERIMSDNAFVISIEEHQFLITQVIGQFVSEALNTSGYCTLRHQLKLYQNQFEGTIYADQRTIGNQYTYDVNPRMEYFKNDEIMGELTLKDMSGKDISTSSFLQKQEMMIKPNQIPEKSLTLKFESVDTEELKDVSVTFNGDRGIFKIGEGEANHYQIPNDKKLWETQFMIISMDGQYYIRDLGFVHTSRIKLDKRSEVQIQKGSIVDLGKVVHYHFDKAIHHAVPTQTPSEHFYTMRPSDKNFDVDTEDFPHLRARPTWVSADENVDNIQNEINVYSDGQKPVNSVGRSMKRDIQIKLKAVSADHCAIAYTKEKGWTITERGKERLSSNGTFIFMKSMQQMNDHIPSDIIPLHDDMIISFVNYELRVSLNQKTRDELDKQAAAMEEFFTNKYSESPQMPATTSMPPEEKKEPAYTAEVMNNNPPPEEEKKEEPATEIPGDSQAIIDGLGATEEELAGAATKIGAVFRGKKAREEVEKKKAEKEASKGPEGSNVPSEAPPVEADKPAEGDPTPAEQPPAEEDKKEEVVEPPVETPAEVPPAENPPAEEEKKE